MLLDRLRFFWAISWAMGLGALGVGCSGEPFFYAAPDSQALGDANQLNMSSAGSQPQVVAPTNTPAQMENAPVPVATGNLCGTLRVGSSMLEDGEVCIPESLFTMGRDENEPVGELAHWPELEMTLSAFAIGEYEVTVVRYRGCVESGACQAPRVGRDQGCTFTEVAGPRELSPVTCVTHAQASAFCAWDIKGSSLPTEAQWERAARGVSSQRYPWGEDIRCSDAVLGGSLQCTHHGGSVPKAVGSAPNGVSEEGVYDLIGNASEWVADWSGSYSQLATRDPLGPDSGVYRIYRGGSWKTPFELSAAHLRWTAGPESTSSFSFRCARPAAP